MVGQAAAGDRVIWASTAPQALAALVATFSGTGHVTLDGPVVTAVNTTEVVTVGWGGKDNETAVETNLDAGSLTGAPDRERYTIHNAVSVLNGSSDMTAARTRAYAILADLGAAIAADPRLGGAVMRAQIAAANLTQSQTQQGALAEIVFDVDCDAFTRR